MIPESGDISLWVPCSFNNGFEHGIAYLVPILSIKLIYLLHYLTSLGA